MEADSVVARGFQEHLLGARQLPAALSLDAWEESTSIPILQLGKPRPWEAVWILKAAQKQSLHLDVAPSDTKAFVPPMPPAWCVLLWGILFYKEGYPLWTWADEAIPRQPGAGGSFGAVAPQFFFLFFS